MTYLLINDLNMPVFHDSSNSTSKQPQSYQELIMSFIYCV